MLTIPTRISWVTDKWKRVSGNGFEISNVLQYDEEIDIIIERKPY